MSDVQFEGENSRGPILYSRFERSEKKPGMVQRLMDKGWAKSEAQANIILIALIVVVVALTVYFLLFFNSSSELQSPPGSRVINISGQLPTIESVNR